MRSPVRQSRVRDDCDDQRLTVEELRSVSETVRAESIMVERVWRVVRVLGFGEVTRVGDDGDDRRLRTATVRAKVENPRGEWRDERGHDRMNCERETQEGWLGFRGGQVGSRGDSLYMEPLATLPPHGPAQGQEADLLARES